MKKRMFIFIVIMLLVVGGCNNQASQLTDQPNDDYPTNTDQIVQENNSNTTDQNVGNKQSGEVDGEEINNTQDDNSQNGNTASPSNKEDNTNKSTNVPEKQVWLDYFDGIDTMINISNYPNGKPNVLNKRNFSENFINDVDLLKELGKEYYSIIVTPSGEYLILWLPIDYTKYLDYDIESSVKKNNKNIDNFLDRYYDLGHNGKIYSVIYSLKQKKIIDLNEVENDSDKEYIYDWVLDNWSYVKNSDKLNVEINDLVI